jgi:hypothetical protein
MRPQSRLSEEQADSASQSTRYWLVAALLGAVQALFSTSFIQTSFSAVALTYRSPTSAGGEPRVQ